MGSIKTTKTQDNSYSLDDTVQLLFSGLDNALDDYEAGREIIVELDTIPVS